MSSLTTVTMHSKIHVNAVLELGWTSWINVTSLVTYICNNTGLRREYFLKDSLYCLHFEF